MRGSAMPSLHHVCITIEHVAVTGGAVGRACMARGRKTALTIRLTEEECQTLTAWQRSTRIPAGRAKRGRIILLLADRVPMTQIATTVGMSRRFVYKWVKRFLAQRLAGLEDKPGRGRRPMLHQHERA
jgi:hypothetical protein